MKILSLGPAGPGAGTAQSTRRGTEERLRFAAQGETRKRTRTGVRYETAAHQAVQTDQAKIKTNNARGDSIHNAAGKVGSATRGTDRKRKRTPLRHGQNDGVRMRRSVDLCARRRRHRDFRWRLERAGRFQNEACQGRRGWQLTRRREHRNQVPVRGAADQSRRAGVRAGGGGARLARLKPRNTGHGRQRDERGALGGAE